MALDRRTFLRLSGLTAVATTLPACTQSSESHPTEATGPADYTIRIGTGLVELSPDHIVATTLYNGQFPGPLIRLREGRSATIDLFNDTDSPEQVHWHGQSVPADVDGSAEEGTPFIAPHGHRRISFTPGPSGLRFYHTHTHAGPDLRAGQYSGQVGIVYVEPKATAGGYDQEVFLLLKEFDPSLSRGGDMAMDFLSPGEPDKQLFDRGDASMHASLAKGMAHGYEVGYGSFAINGKMLGHGDPIRVKVGQRVLLHVVNGSATEIRSLALPGHTFEVVALDGNPVPTPLEVPVLWIGTGERVSAVVEMRQSGVWVLGDVSDDDREHGMGVAIEYAGAKGKPQWSKPKPFKWDYTRFGHDVPMMPPDETLEMTFSKDNAAANGFNRWLINGAAFSMEQKQPIFRVEHGKRYRLHMRNASDDIHPMHLHRHTFELSNVAGRATAGVMKDVVMLGGYQEMGVDFTATSPGLSLLHCHMQLHMDYGFMALIDCR